ncbi:MAG: DNA repair protein RadA [Bacteroidetes bacterium]|nr:DNA repair protein RadA [Bacteroidota bacterium]
MAKQQIVFYCKNCGYSSPKWMGKCNSCGQWNTLVEEVVVKEKNERTDWKESTTGKKSTPKVRPLSEVEAGNEQRLVTSDAELNRVLGGGIVAGSVVLIGGEPGIGKSTLLLQIALSLQHQNILYISGEESEAQIKMRADRIGTIPEHCYILTETNTKIISQQLKQLKPDIVIVDSIQTLFSENIDSTAGSITQIRECAGELLRFAKESNTPVFLIGHITKDGSIAGPKLLEHMVDTVLQFEGDRHYSYRILRTIKNRFGSTAALGIYEMQGSGLRQVSNPSEILISQRDEAVTGVAISAALEGLRPMLIEIQALVSATAYGMPQRTATGFDLRRMSMLLAVLEKKCGFRFGTQDVFLNIAGGLRIEDPAVDLSVVAALVSSNQEMVIDSKICFTGEIGLSGEIRSVNRIEQRIAEAEKLGFEQIFISRYNTKGLSLNKYKIEINTVSKLDALFSQLFG